MDRFERLSKIAQDEFGATIKSKPSTGETFDSLYGETKDSDRREKQIEAMANDLSKYSFFYNGNCLMNYSKTAKFLYNAGYRKQSEVVKEIFEEIDNIIEKGGAE